METKTISKKGKALPVFNESCVFDGYEPEQVMNETKKLRGLNTRQAEI